jgi:hypothetical protein
LPRLNQHMSRANANILEITERNKLYSQHGIRERW